MYLYKKYIKATLEIGTKCLAVAQPIRCGNKFKKKMVRQGRKIRRKTEITMETKNNEPLTKAICNMGFSGNSSVLLRSNFGVGGQDSSPQSLTAHSLNRYVQP